MEKANIYLLIHLIGIFMALAGLFGSIVQGLYNEPRAKGLISATHGAGLLLALFGGFGLMAVNKFSYGSGWFIIKVLIWVALGGLPVVARKNPGMSRVLWFSVIALAALAGAMAIFKPFDGI